MEERMTPRRRRRGTGGLICWVPQFPQRPPSRMLVLISLRTLCDTMFEHRGRRRGARGPRTRTGIGTPAATGIRAIITTTNSSDHHCKSFPSPAYHRRPRSSPPVVRPPPLPAVHDDDDNVRGSLPATIVRDDKNTEDVGSRCSVQSSEQVPTPGKTK